MNALLKEDKNCTMKCGAGKDHKIHYPIETGVDKEHFDDLSEKEKQLALRWLRYNLIPASKPMMQSTSYGMKHVLERRTNIYMTNNQFKEAMLRCGYPPREAGEDNWHFCVSKRSPIFKRQIDDEFGLPMLGEPMDYSKSEQ